MPTGRDQGEADSIAFISKEGGAGQRVDMVLPAVNTQSWGKEEPVASVQKSSAERNVRQLTSVELFPGCQLTVAGQRRRARG